MVARNILNADQVTAFIQDLATLAAREEVRVWFGTTVRKWLLNRYEPVWQVFLRAERRHLVAQQFNVGAAIDLGCLDEPHRFPAWVHRAVATQTPLHYIVLSDTLRERLFVMLDYLDNQSDHRVLRKLNRVTVEQVEAAAREAADRNALRRVLDQAEIVYDFPDGFRVVHLRTAAELDLEGELMDHCVGGYTHLIAHAMLDILSLRDARNRPHATLEAHGADIVQIKGKANGPVADRYAGYLRTFLQDMGYRVVADGENIAWTELGGRYVDDLNAFVRREDWTAPRYRDWLFGRDPDDWCEVAPVMGALVQRARELGRAERKVLREAFESLAADRTAGYEPVGSVDVFGCVLPLFDVRFPVGLIWLGMLGLFDGGRKGGGRAQARRQAMACVTHLFGRLAEVPDALYRIGRPRRDRRGRPLLPDLTADPGDMGALSPAEVIDLSLIDLHRLRADRRRHLERLVRPYKERGLPWLKDYSLPAARRLAWSDGYAAFRDLVEASDGAYL